MKKEKGLSLNWSTRVDKYNSFVKRLTVAFVFFIPVSVSAQQANKDSSKLIISGYADIYYAYDLNDPTNNTRPPFVYSYSRTNEISVNLGYIKAAYTTDRVRANIALIAGTYANANLALEPGVLKNILEANTGIQLAKNTDFWLDAGVFSSHIGFESAISKDCWTVTRSILADNSPYYESGAKLGYTSHDGKYFISALVLNGWQHIQRPDGNKGLSVGLQFTYKPTENITLNYSNFFGNDHPDSTSRRRFYNNFYGIFQLSKKFGITGGFDFASEQKYHNSPTYNYLFSPVVIARYSFADDFALAARVEYYQDKNGILISTGTPNGFKTTGYSINADYSPFKSVLLRVEGKYYNSKDEIFIQSSYKVNYNTVITTSMAVAF